MKRIRLLMFLTLLTGFILSACSCDDIVMDNVQEQKDVQRTQYIQTSYEKAYAKMLGQRRNSVAELSEDDRQTVHEEWQI